MKSLLRVLLVSGLLLIFTACIASAAGGDPVLKAMGTASGQTTLNWAFAAGDTMEYSLDGITWVAIPVGGAGLHSDAAANGNNLVVGLTDYTNYYFRVKHASGAFSTIADAFPPNEHAHRYFASDTNLCAKCHGTHTAVGYHLVKKATVDAMCITCHAGTGAKYQVDNSTAATANGTIAALGGPFGTQVNPASTAPVTSSHKLGATLTMAPGGDTGNGNGKWSAALGCGSCHSAHSTIAYQYRLLKNSLPYMPNDASGKPIASIDVEAYAVTKADKEVGVYVSGMNTFCGGCHADYNTTDVSAAAHNKNHVFGPDFYRHQVGYDIAEFRHGVGLTSTLPLESANGNAAFLSDGTLRKAGFIACMTCHKPHGVTTVSEGSSSLLIMKNRGVCQDCHKK